MHAPFDVMFIITFFFSFFRVTLVHWVPQGWQVLLALR